MRCAGEGSAPMSLALRSARSEASAAAASACSALPAAEATRPCCRSASASDGAGAAGRGALTSSGRMNP